MSEPINQHYIPRSYLKNFAECKKKKKEEKCYVEVYYKKDDIIRQNINTKTICYEKHLYTLKTKDDSKKYNLELYYANNVDSEFQKIYKLLIDKEKKTLTKAEKLKVLYVCLSLYFRTPIHLNHVNSFTDQHYDHLKLYADETGFVKTKMFGGEKIHINELENLKQKSKENSKTKFHIDHMEKWFEFVEHKYECTINVIEIQDKDAYLITSDNPVIIRERYSNKFKGLFNPNNVITMPLDPKHFLEIHPNTIANNEYEIQRLTHDTDYVFTINNMTEQNSDNLLIGKKNTIDFHFKMQKKYENPENGEKFIEKIKFKAESLQELLKITQSYGSNSKELIPQLKKMHKSPFFKDDKQLANYIEQYKKMNLW